MEDCPKDGAWYRELSPTLGLDAVEGDPTHLMQRVQRTLDHADEPGILSAGRVQCAPGPLHEVNRIILDTIHP